MVWFGLVGLMGVAVAEPVVLPDTDVQVEFDDSADAAVVAGYDALAGRRFDDAARGFHALAEAGGGADAYYLEGVAWYEAGQVHRARRAAEAGLDDDRDHAPLLALRGLVLADQGRGDEALEMLGRAAGLGTPVVRARAALNQGLVHLDDGRADEAESKFREAVELATTAGAPDLVEIAEANLAGVGALRGEGSGADVVGRVVAKLRKGDVDGARTLLPMVREGDRRGRVRSLIAEGSVLRAEGGLDKAAGVLHEAVTLAQDGGLVREHAAALASLGVVYRVGGRPELARQALVQAVSLVAGGSFRVNEVAYRIEAGLVALELGDPAGAETELKAAVARGAVDDPVIPSRIKELRGGIALARGDVDVAVSELDVALDRLDVAGMVADAARIGTTLVRVEARRGEDSRYRKVALSLFERAGDPLGPAHVAVARGLGRVDAADAEGALKHFATAAKLGKGSRVGQIAEANAAEVLKSAGIDTPDGLDAAVARHESVGEGRKAYDAGRAAYDAKQYSQATSHFADAIRAFEGAGDEEFLRAARRGAGWARYNHALSLPPAQQLPLMLMVEQAGEQTGDAELRVRGLAMRASASAQLKKKGAAQLLEQAAEDARRQGADALAGGALAELALLPGDLQTRARAARGALGTLGATREAVYAMYAVAVDAYNEGSYELAAALADEVLPVAGDQAAAVREVAAAAKGVE